MEKAKELMNSIQIKSVGNFATLDLRSQTFTYSTFV